MEKIILFINRDRTFLERSSTILEKSGYSIHTATDLGSALAVLSSHSVGLIICDNKLKDISGQELLYFIKNDPLREKIPFMFLVSTKNQGEAFRAFKLNAVDYLVYPIDYEILIDKIDEVFSCTGLQKAPPDKPIPMKKEEVSEKRESNTIKIPGLSIDVSRDSAIWLPGKITSFSRTCMFIETSLFGKPGMFLIARFNLEGENVNLNGNIKNISYEDFQKPANIEMTIQEDQAWQSVHDLLAGQFSEDVEKTDETDDIEQEVLDLGEDFLTSPKSPEKNIIKTGSFQPVEISKTSYDQRFYHSIIGKQLDQYRAITLISTSGMGGLMQGWDVDQEREVALKIISYDLAGQPEFYERFFKEAHIVSRLNNPSIATIYYFGTSSDILYYATEFIDGLTLEDLIDRQGNLNNMTGLEHMMAVCEALSFVHQNNLVHRNIKPANIMFDNTGALKIIDFGMGLGGDDGKLVEGNPVIGLPVYMSPEQAAGRGVDSRSDVYSVGASFYHAFTGSPPFEGKDLSAFIASPIKTPLPSMKDKNPDVPNSLIQIIEKMMAKAPLNRYQDFKAVYKDLKSLHDNSVKRRRAASGNPTQK